jgi:hypothetical protein
MEGFIKGKLSIVICWECKKSLKDKCWTALQQMNKRNFGAGGLLFRISPIWFRNEADRLDGFAY